MRIKARFPEVRENALRMIKMYTMFLWMNSLLLAMIMGVEALKINLIATFEYLVATVFFITSALISSELFHQLRRIPFRKYWRFFKARSFIVGEYLTVHIITGLIFIAADLLRSGFAPLAIMIIVKGVFEYMVVKYINNLTVASFLYDEIIKGEVDRLSMIDPFR